MRILCSHGIVRSNAEHSFSNDISLDFIMKNPYRYIYTFDDGLKSLYEPVKWLSQKCPGIRIKLFVCPDYINRIKYPWWLEIENNVLMNNTQNIERYLGLTDLNKNKKSKTYLYNSLCHIFKNVHHASHESLLIELFGTRRLNHKDSFLSWNDLKELTNFGNIKIGSHTQSHRKLTMCSEIELKHELYDSKRAVEQNIGGKCEILAIPHGGSSEVSNKVIQQATHVYKKVYTTEKLAKINSCLPRTCTKPTNRYHYYYQILPS